MTPSTVDRSRIATPDYGIDAPAVLRNLFLFGAVALVIGLQPYQIQLGTVTIAHGAFLCLGGCLVAEGLLYLFYVKKGKHRHRDALLALYPWRGDEQVLDVGCGRGLLLAGAAKRIPNGQATGIDLWSSVDMGGNSPEATLLNLEVEGVADRCSILSTPVQEMAFPDDHFDVIVSNLCLHNIYDKRQRQRALEQIARVLKPGGVALLSDYKHTRQYCNFFRALGFNGTRKRGNILATFPPLAIVIVRKPGTTPEPSASKQSWQAMKRKTPLSRSFSG